MNLVQSYVVVVVLVTGTTLSTASFSDELSEPVRVRGVVTSVNDAGDITILETDPDVPGEVRLWGVQITERASFSSFIIGRYVDCRVIYFLEDVPYAVCNAATNEFRLEVREPDLQLSVWLPELGWAEAACTDKDFRQPAVTESGEGWMCSQNGNPLYFRPDATEGFEDE